MIAAGALGLVLIAGTPADASPAVKLADFLSAANRRVVEITESQIAKMRSLIAVTGEDDPQKPDFFFRLGELYAENQRAAFSRAHALDQRIFDAPAGEKAALQQQQRRWLEQEQAWLLRAVEAYLSATRYRKYERMDEVLFRLAALLTEAKKEDRAREFLARLLKDHPTSRYVPDAYLAFAELSFDRGEIDGALRFYEKVEAFPASGVFPYAVYKKGWCQVNLGDFKAALGTFIRVARLSEDATVRAPRKQLDLLAREVRKDIVTAYARVGGPDKAEELFRRVGGDAAGKMLEALAERYWEQGQAPDSTRVYKRLIAENASSPLVCGWQGKVLRNGLSGGDKSAQAEELERLGAVYEKRPPPDGARARECRSAFHDGARELAVVWHREAQKTRNADTYRFAERAYHLFLAHFADDRDAYEMSYYEGELLWALERWKDAAEQFTRVVEMQPGGKYLREAAHAAVLAWKNALAGADDEKREGTERGRERLRDRARAGRLAPLPIPESQRKMIAALQTYRRQVPDAPELPALLYREAYIDYDHNHLDDAEPLFLEVVQKHTTHELAPFAANLFLDALNAQGKSHEVARWVRAFMEMPPLMADRAFAAQMITLLSDVYELEAREGEQRGDAKECGRSFIAAAEAQPDHPKHAERLWNAAQCFQNAHLVGRAINAWKALIDQHPADALAKRAIFRVAAGYHKLAYYTEAADRYEAFARRFPGEPQAPAALANAAVFREGLGQNAEAIADMDAFARFYGARDPQGAAGAFFQKAEVYEAQGATDALRAHLRSYLDTWARHGGLDRQVQAHFRLGELAWKASCPQAAADGACVHVERVTATRGQQLLTEARRRLGKGKRTQCGPLTKSRILVLERDRRQAAAAEEHFITAIRLWRAGDAAASVTGRDADARKAAAARAVAGAAFYLAEKAYEDLLRIKFPQNLDFSSRDARKREDAKRRFTAYLAEKTRALEKARAEYLDVFELRQAQWTIAAAARVAQLHQDFAGQLYTAEIPRDLPEVDAWGNRPRDLYCNELEDQAGKLEAQAVDALKSCLDAATRASWFNEWSRLCERELNQLAPAQFPLASEVKPEPRYAPTTMAAATMMSLPSP